MVKESARARTGSVFDELRERFSEKGIQLVQHEEGDHGLRKAEDVEESGIGPAYLKPGLVHKGKTAAKTRATTPTVKDPVLLKSAQAALMKDAVAKHGERRSRVHVGLAKSKTSASSPCSGLRSFSQSLGGESGFLRPTKSSMGKQVKN